MCRHDRGLGSRATLKVAHGGPRWTRQNSWARIRRSSSTTRPGLVRSYSGPISMSQASASPSSAPRVALQARVDHLDRAQAEVGPVVR
eukprot:15456336-Alexandrium_andersonii.AAC.1